MKCELCEKETKSELCRYHAEAKKQVVGAYRSWREAYGSVGWNEYLERLAENPETGQWAKDVARLMLRAPAKAPACTTSP
jgi:hypothetical protein